MKERDVETTSSAKVGLPKQQPILDRARRVHERLDDLATQAANLHSTFAPVLSDAESMKDAEGNEASEEASTLEETLACMERKILDIQDCLSDLADRNRL